MLNIQNNSALLNRNYNLSKIKQHIKHFKEIDNKGCGKSETNDVIGFSVSYMLTEIKSLYIN